MGEGVEGRVGLGDDAVAGVIVEETGRSGVDVGVEEDLYSEQDKVSQGKLWRMAGKVPRRTWFTAGVVWLARRKASRSSILKLLT